MFAKRVLTLAVIATLAATFSADAATPSVTAVAIGDHTEIITVSTTTNTLTFAEQRYKITCLVVKRFTGSIAIHGLPMIKVPSAHIYVAASNKRYTARVHLYTFGTPGNKTVQAVQGLVTGGGSLPCGTPDFPGSSAVGVAIIR